MEYLIIQVEEHQVIVARFELTRRSATLAGSALFVLDDELDVPAVAARISEGISGSPRVILCLPPLLFAQRTVELPLKDLHKVREVLSAHLQGEIALPVEEVVFDALQISKGKFLALWAQRTEIAKAVELFKDAGVEPAVVTATPFAWPYLPDLPADCAVSDGSAVALIANGHLSFTRALPAGERRKVLTATLSALEMAGDALPNALIVFGEQAGELVNAIDLPLSVNKLELQDELGHLFRSDQAFQQLAGLYAVALASQSRQLPDFRRGSLAWTAGDAKLRKKLVVTAILSATMILLLFVSKGLQYRAALADTASLNSSIAAMYRDVFPTRTKAVDEVAEIKGEIRKLSGADSSSGVLDLLKQLAEAKGASINGLYEAEIEGRTVRVKGDARSAQAVNEFKSALMPAMASIELGEVKSRPDGSVTFSLTAALKEAKK
jgi:general secretion pathway protein L